MRDKLSRNLFSEDDLIFEDAIITDSFDGDILSIKGDLVFRNCTFENDIRISNMNVRSLVFYGCKSEKSVFFEGLNIVELVLKGTSFGDILVDDSKILFLNFDYVKAYELQITSALGEAKILSSRFTNLNFSDKYDKISNSHLNSLYLNENIIDRLEFNFRECNLKAQISGGTYKDVYFQGYFNKSITFRGSTEINNLYFESSIIRDRIDYYSGNFGWINYNRSEIIGLTVFSGFNYLNNRNEDLKVENLNLNSSIFHKNFITTIKHLKSLNISDCNFYQSFDLDNLSQDEENMVIISLDGRNQGALIFKNTYTYFSFSGINAAHVTFKGVNINTIVLNEFENIGTISFIDITAKHSFVIHNSVSGKLNFLNLDINDFKEIIVANSNIESANFYKYPITVLSRSLSEIDGYGLSKHENKRNNLKNVYNQLKKISIAKGDIDNASRFAALEHRMLFLSKPFSFDSILLFLNFLSNDFGKSWFRGLLFTLLVSFLFFILYIDSQGYDFLAYECYEDFIYFLTSYPKLEISGYNNEKWKSQLIILLARIFISYGIFQTVSAFRKYGKS